MKRTFIFVLVTMLSYPVLAQQQSKEMVTYSYEILISDAITDITIMNQQKPGAEEEKNEEQQKDISLGDVFSSATNPTPDTSYYVDPAGEKTIFLEGSGGNMLVASLLDTLYSMLSQRFADSLNIRLYPLGELKNKVTYNSAYPCKPDEYSKRRAIKAAKGYERYCLIYINFNTGTSVGVKGLTVGQKLPKIWFRMKVYDEDRNKLKKLSVKKSFSKDIGVHSVKHEWIQRKDYPLKVMRKNLSMLFEATLPKIIKAYQTD